jgi:hypothetical protein
VLTNYFLNKKLVSKEDTETDDVTIEVAEGETDYAEIGNKKFDSETILPGIYQTDDLPFSLVDTGGFLDTREGYEIPVAISKKLILENAQTVRVVLCVTSKSIDNTKGTEFKSFLSRTLGNLIKNYKDENNKDAIYLMITRPHMVGSQRKPRLYSVDDAKHNLKEMKSGFNEDNEAHHFLNFLLRENGKYISVCNPLDENGGIDTEGRKKYLQIFENMTPIKNCKDAFQVSYSEHVELKMLKKFTSIAEMGCGLFERINQNLNEIKEFDVMIGSIIDQMIDRKNTISILEKKGDVSLIEKSSKLQIEGLRINIIDQNNKIDLLINEKKEFSCEIDEIKNCIKSEDDKSNESVMFWEKSYQEKAKRESYPYERLETDDEFNEKLRIAEQESITKMKVLKRMGKQLVIKNRYQLSPLIKLFEYSEGIEIDKIVKIPTDKKYWSQETENPKSKKHYAVLYTTDDEAKADAKIQIYVLYKNHPDSIKKRTGLVEEQKLQEGFLKKKEIEIENAQKLLKDKETLKQETECHLQETGNVAENIMNEIKNLKQEITSLEQKEKDSKSDKEKRLKNIEQVKKEIDQKRDDFDFVVDFLSYDNNKTIMDNKTIQVFKENYEKYK